MKSLLPTLALAVGLAGCAGAPKTPTGPAAAGQAEQDVSCEVEIPTGSMFPIKRCRTAAQREAERKAADEAGDAIRRGKPAAPSQPGT